MFLSNVVAKNRSQLGYVLIMSQTEIKHTKDAGPDFASNLSPNLRLMSHNLSQAVMSLICSAEWKVKNPERERLKVKVVAG